MLEARGNSHKACIGRWDIAFASSFVPQAAIEPSAFEGQTCHTAHGDSRKARIRRRDIALAFQSFFPMLL